GVVMATFFVPDIQAERPARFDFIGFVLSGLGIGGLAFGFSVLGLALLPARWIAALIGVGAVSAVAYVCHARRTPAPILDLGLFKLETLRDRTLGGFVFRLGIGALPLFLPLLSEL